jgi:peptide/nickel transport system substrate-binding protein
VAFSDPAADRLIERASRETDPDASAKLYARADSLIYAQAPWLYLYFPRSFHAVSARVHGFRLPTLYLGGDYTDVYKGGAN